jgi:hypothetical protein
MTGINERMVALEEFRGSLDGLGERLETVEVFNKAFGEDFDFAKIEERIVAIEDMPLVKGVGTLPPQGMADIHAKIGEFNNFEDGARYIRSLQT